MQCRSRLVASAAAVMAFSATQVTRAQAPLRQIPVDDARADLAQLEAAIEEAHGAPFRFTARTTLEARWAGYRAAITNPLAPVELLELVHRMLADIGDGHARAALDTAAVRLTAGAKLLPLRVRLESGDHLVVTSNDMPADTSIRPGDELLRVNGRPVAALLARLRPLVPRDGRIATGRDSRLARSFPALYHDLVEPVDVFELDVRDHAGAMHRVRLAGVTDQERSVNRNAVNAAYLAQSAALDGGGANISLRFPGSGTVGVLRVRSFVPDAFTQELDSVFRIVAARAPSGIVLDLRGNGGGVDMYGANLVSHFTSAPFRYFDRIHIATRRPSFTTFLARTYASLDSGTVADPRGGWLALPSLHPGVAPQLPSPTTFTGPLVVLMDGGTFSTAADVTAALRGLGRATFIGEESGGAYEGNTSGMGALVTLAHSGIRVWVQMYGYVNAVPAPREGGRGTLPDVTVPTTVADILRGADPALERALHTLTPH